LTRRNQGGEIPLDKTVLLSVERVPCSGYGVWKKRTTTDWENFYWDISVANPVFLSSARVM